MGRYSARRFPTPSDDVADRMGVCFRSAGVVHGGSWVLVD
jgi:hypothetical protein